MRTFIASGLALLAACSSSTSTTNTSSTKQTNVCCINDAFYSCASGCAETCPRAPDRDEECGGGGGGSSSTSSTSSTSSSSSSSSGGRAAKKRGDHCTCEAQPGGEAAVYAECLGNVDACNTLSLACLYEVKSGDGVCVVPCSKSKANDPNACSNDLTCGASGFKGVTGDDWYTCR